MRKIMENKRIPAHMAVLLSFLFFVFVILENLDLD